MCGFRVTLQRMSLADFLGYGPAAFLYLLAMAAQVSGYASPTIAILLAMAGTIWLIGHWVHKWHLRRITAGKAGVDPSRIIAVCLVGAALLLMGAAGTYIWQQFLSRAASQEAGGRNAISKVEFARNEIIGSYSLYDPARPQLVTYVADLISMGDRLRVFVDYSLQVPNTIGLSGWTNINRIQIADFKDYVRGQRLTVHVLSRYEDGNNKNLMRWGAQEAEPPDNEHKFALVNTYRARIVITGSDGKEQHRYFYIVRSATPDGTVTPFVVDAIKSFEWIAQWEQEAAYK
jgi:hypothetical protein